MNKPIVWILGAFALAAIGAVGLAVIANISAGVGSNLPDTLFDCIKNSGLQNWVDMLPLIFMIGVVLSVAGFGAFAVWSAKKGQQNFFTVWGRKMATSAAAFALLMLLGFGYTFVRPPQPIYADVACVLVDGSRPLTANWAVGGFAITGASQLTSTSTAAGTYPAIFSNTTNNGSVAAGRFLAARSAPTDADELYVSYTLNNDAGTPAAIDFAREFVVANDVSAGTEDGSIRWQAMVSGTRQEMLRLDVTTGGVPSAIFNNSRLNGYLWDVYSAAPNFIAETATGGATTKDVTLTLGANYWNGAASTAFNGAWTMDMLTTGPTAALKATINSVALLDLGTAGAVFNEGSADLDLRVEGDNNANMLVVDAGTDSLAFGGGVVSGAFFAINGSAVDRTFVTSVGYGLHSPNASFNDNGGATTKAVVARNFFGGPTVSATNAQTYTNASTVHIASAPTASTNVTITDSYAFSIGSGRVLIAQSNASTVGMAITNSSLNAGQMLNLTLSGSSAVATAASSGSMLTLTSTTTGFTGATQRLAGIFSSGANSTASAVVTGMAISVTNTGTTNSNYALTLTASGGSTANRALNITAGDVILAGSGALLAQNATTGFTYVPGVATGEPSGTPADLPTGAVPMGVDVVGNQVCFYYGGAWKCAALS